MLRKMLAIMSLFGICNFCDSCAEPGHEQFTKECDFLERTDFDNVRSIRFIGIDIDRAFIDHWSDNVLFNEFDTISFEDCNFPDKDFCIFDDMKTKTLRVCRCGITPEDVEQILRVDPDVVTEIDLSGNSLSKEDPEVQKALQTHWSVSEKANICL